MYFLSFSKVAFFQNYIKSLLSINGSFLPVKLSKQFTDSNNKSFVKSQRKQNFDNLAKSQESYNMFEKTLKDIARGLLELPDESMKQIYVARVLQEIKKEISLTDMALKSNAILKLIYLHILGYDMDWAAFNIIEIMSHPSFRIRRIGNLAASQCFTEDTDVLLLCSNLIKKGLNHPDPYFVGNTLSCLSNICTKELAIDLLEDAVKHLESKFPYIRKKAILSLYKLYIKYPKALPETFDKLKLKLEDKDLSVVGTAVSVMCELAFKNPSNYLSLAPFLFNLLKTSENSWMLIKIIKLLTKLCNIEPRLAKKLIDPLCLLINENTKPSLEYECIISLCVCFPYSLQVSDGTPKNLTTAVALCIERLTKFVQSNDSNQKYLGLQGFSLLTDFDPKLINSAIDSVLLALDHEDYTIRNKSLEIIKKFVNSENLESLVEKLMTQLESTEDPNYKDLLLDTILYMCHYDQYLYCENFAWYLSVLVDLAYEQNTTKGKVVSEEIMDVVLRVPEVHEYAVELCTPLLKDPVFLDGNLMTEVLCACAWVVGEHSKNISIEEHTNILKSLLKPESISFPYTNQSMFIQCSLKLFISLLKLLKESETEEDVLLKKSREVAYFITVNLDPFTQSYDVEVQSRAFYTQKLFITLDPFISEEYRKLTETVPDTSEAKELEKTESGVIKHKLMSLTDVVFTELEPIHEIEVNLPEDLDLDKWIGEPFESKLEIHNILSFAEKVPEIKSMLPEISDKDDTDVYYLSTENDPNDDELYDDVIIEEIKPEDLGNLELKSNKRHKARRNAPQLKYTVKRSENSDRSLTESNRTPKTPTNMPEEPTLSTISLTKSAENLTPGGKEKRRHHHHSSKRKTELTPKEEL